VKVLCPRADAQRVADAVRDAAPDSTVLVAGPGPGARLSDEDGR
jgi:diphosphomevalonate decarboxylase